jgi:hypothetical protein
MILLLALFFILEQSYDEYGNSTRSLLEFYDTKTDELLLRYLTEMDGLDDWNRIATFHETSSYSGSDESHMKGTYTYTCH